MLRSLRILMRPMQPLGAASRTAAAAAIAAPSSVQMSPRLFTTAAHARTAASNAHPSSCRCCAPSARNLSTCAAAAPLAACAASFSSPLPLFPTSSSLRSRRHAAASSLRSFSTLESIGDSLPGVPVSDDPHARFVVVYTCGVCELRSAKSVSRQAYAEGVVLLRCDGCKKLHLFADHLGWFDDERIDIESIMREKGVTVGRSSLDLAPEQLQQLAELQKSMQAQADARKARAAAAGDASSGPLKGGASEDAEVVPPPPALDK